MRGLTYLMYHEIARAGIVPARSDASYLRYVIGADIFVRQLDMLSGADRRGIDVGTALGARNDCPGAVVLTFDDGCESDLVVAAPLLVERGWSATFYVTVAHVGTPGFLDRSQLRELADNGFEIGSHAYTHTYLTGLDARGIGRELLDAKRWLEDATGREVRHLSCPGGRWSPLVARIAADSSYASVAISRPVPNAAGADPFCLGRFAVTTATDARTFRFIMNGRLPLAARCRERATSWSRSLLGDRRYDLVRERLLRT